MYKCTYALREDTLLNENGKEINVYGVNCIHCGKVTKSLADIFTDKEKAAEFVDLCNKSELSEIHFLDAVEDILLA